MNGQVRYVLFVAEVVPASVTLKLDKLGIDSDIAMTKEQFLRQLALKSPDLILFSTDSDKIDPIELAKLTPSASPGSILLCCTKERRTRESINVHLATQLPLISVADEDSFCALVSAFLLPTENQPVNQKQVEQSLQGHEYRDLQQDQMAGFAVQQQLLPMSGQCLAGMNISYKLFPSLFVSGDTVGVEELQDGRVLFYLADVSGHGVAGALVTVLLNSLLRHDVRNRSKEALGSTGEIVERLNIQLLTHNLEQHITILLAIYDESAGALQYSNAAQFPAALVKTADGATPLNIGGLPLGVCEAHYKTFNVALPSSFELVLFSDGVLEILPQMSIKDKEDHLLSMVTDGNGQLDTLVTDLGLDDVTSIPDDIAIFTLAKTG